MRVVNGYSTTGALSTASNTAISGSVTSAHVRPAAVVKVRSSAFGGHNRNTGGTKSSNVTAPTTSSDEMSGELMCTESALGEDGTNVFTSPVPRRRLEW